MAHAFLREVRHSSRAQQHRAQNKARAEIGVEATERRWHIMPFRPVSRTIERTPMPTRNVVLTERQEELIDALVKSGRYQNASEVLRDGLRLVEQREAEDAGKLKALRAAARLGVGALDRGEFKEFRSIEDLQAYLNDLSEKVISGTGE
ncbi:putative addiction module CopG family antidote [Bradyrhizobium sp. USDA 10063]